MKTEDKFILAKKLALEAHEREQKAKLPLEEQTLFRLPDAHCNWHQEFPVTYQGTIARGKNYTAVRDFLGALFVNTWGISRNGTKIKDLDGDLAPEIWNLLLALGIGSRTEVKRVRKMLTQKAAFVRKCSRIQDFAEMAEKAGISLTQRQLKQLARAKKIP